MNKRTKVVKASKKGGGKTRTDRAPIRIDATPQGAPAGPIESASVKIGHDGGDSGDGSDKSGRP